jgi:lipopolysaccharide/colanic/teichoic acid biosynthesis glycosyltransferase
VLCNTAGNYRNDPGTLRAFTSVASNPRKPKMKNKSLVSKSRQRTKGGSLPALRSACSDLHTRAPLAATRGTHPDDGEQPFRTKEESRDRGVSIFLQRTILQLFSPNGGATEVAESSTNGAWKSLPKEEMPEALSFGPTGRAINDRTTEALVIGIAGRFPLWKRTLDLCFVFLTMCVWLPLMILVMCLIKLVSPGPALYRQQRIGFRARPFMIFKFRSMKVDAETQTHEEYVGKLMRSESPLTKLDSNDPRLISVGRFLRATGLDELPQLFNVLRGDMSLVGPRPCTVREFEKYLPWQKMRVKAPPGLTGYWQVNGKNKTTFNQMMQMDLDYAQKMSLRLDLSIICKTLPAIFEQTLESFSGKSSKREGGELTAVIFGRSYSGSMKQL